MEGERVLAAEGPLSPLPRASYASALPSAEWVPVAEFDPEPEDVGDAAAESVVPPAESKGDDDGPGDGAAVVPEPEVDDLDDPSIPDALLAFGFCRSCKDSPWLEALSYLKKGRKRGAFDVNTPDEQGFTPLGIATRGRNVPVIKGLLKEGADANIPGPNGLCPLHYALVLTDAEEIVEVLLKGGADPDVGAADGTTPVHVAALNGNSQALELLLGLGSGDPNGQRVGSGGATPLYGAAFRGHLIAATVLLKHGALVDLYKEGGFTPLFAAAEQNQVEMVKLLLTAGADPNSKDYRKATPLFIACVSNHVEIVQALCAVPRTAVNYAGVAGGVTALYIACELGHADVVKALLSGVKPAVVTTANKFGALPIHAAAEAGHDAVVRLLLAAGSPRTEAVAGPRKWLTPLYLACQGGHATVCHTLVWWAPGDDAANIKSPTAAAPPPAAGVSAALAAEAGATFVRRGGSGSRKPPRRRSNGSVGSIASVGFGAEEEAVNTNVPVAAVTGVPPPRTTRRIHRRALEKPLFVACRKGHGLCVRVLLDAGVNPDCIREDTRATPLFTAALHAAGDVIGTLVLAGADPNKPDRAGITPLSRAVRLHNPATVRLLVTHGAGVNAEEPGSGRSPLHEAAQEGDVPTVEALLQLGARLNAQDTVGQSPLVCAVLANHTACTLALLGMGADAMLSDRNGVSPLYAAAANGNAEIVRALLGVPAVAGSEEHIHRRNKAGGASPLFAAAAVGAAACVTALAEAGADVNSADSEGHTPLMMCAKGGHEEAVKALLERKANVACLTPSECYTALHFAAAGGYVGIIAALVAAKASKDCVSTSGSLTPLMLALMGAKIAAANLLLDLGASAAIPDSSGMSTLHFAIQLNDMALLDRLLASSGIAPALNNVRLPDRCTPLFLASQMGIHEAVTRLLAVGVDVEVPNRVGATPLFIAAQEGYTPIVQALLSAGANPNATAMPPDNLFPLFSAALAGHAPCVQALVLGGAYLNQTTASGATAFHAACSEGQLAAAVVLIRAGINHEIRAVDGRTGVEIARKFGHNQFVSAVKPLMRTLAKEAAEAQAREGREKEREANQAQDAADEDLT